VLSWCDSVIFNNLTVNHSVSNMLYLLYNIIYNIITLAMVVHVYKQFIKITYIKQGLQQFWPITAIFYSIINISLYYIFVTLS